MDADYHPWAAGVTGLTREEEFLERWHQDRPAYEAWGKQVSASVMDALVPIISPIAPSYFLKTAVQPRVKDDQKLIEKAFFRKKPYADPYADITDKVGTRFVVLLGSEVAKVEAALTSHGEWTYSKDRDYEAEQRENPQHFDYAAVHYVVRNARPLTYEGIEIPIGTPCEVQIKTLLQHAFSELTHDTIYKPQIEATPGMRRSAAKAMALLEATNDYFEKVADDVAGILAKVRMVTANLSDIYRTLIGIEPRPSILEGMLLDAYEPMATDNYTDQITTLVGEKPFIAEAIRTRVGQSNPVFAQPSVLLIYLAVDKSVRKATAAWPLTANEIEPILNDFGESNH
jgi:putative GTP pyrophosphokinase